MTNHSKFYLLQLGQWCRYLTTNKKFPGISFRNLCRTQICLGAKKRWICWYSRNDCLSKQNFRSQTSWFYKEGPSTITWHNLHGFNRNKNYIFWIKSRKETKNKSIQNKMECNSNSISLFNCSRLCTVFKEASSIGQVDFLHLWRHYTKSKKKKEKSETSSFMGKNINL